MRESLAKVYENYKENGGEIAIRGFNFQAYSGIYYMLFLHKNSVDFKIRFEHEDDIVIEDNTNNKKFKIQVKSENLTINKIIKKDSDGKSILGKLLFSDDFNYYILAFPNETGESIKKICDSTENILGGFSHCLNKKEEVLLEKQKNELINVMNHLNELDSTSKELIFQEMPFTKDGDNCFHYLCGYSNNAMLENEKKIPLKKEELSALLGTIYSISDKKFKILNLDNSVLYRLEDIDKEEKAISEYLDILKFNKSPAYADSLLQKKGIFEKDIIYYREILDKIELPAFDEESFIKYYDNCAQLIEKKLDESQKKIICKYIKGWYIMLIKIMGVQNNEN